MRHRETVVTCYSFFDKLFPCQGMPDYTEGMFAGDASLPLSEAQRNQNEFLLDEARCEAGSRLLDIGCGNGQLLVAARDRGADAMGITISPEQVARCQTVGLDVRLMDYRQLPYADLGTFDAVVANGSIEHFANAEDALSGRDNVIYRDLFSMVHRLIEPRSSVRRFVTTAIHFARRPKPGRLLEPAWHFAPGSDEFHYALLNRCFGGWYPSAGQFERCAHGKFRLIHTVDGTSDYHITSEIWLRRVKDLLRQPCELWAFAKRACPVAARSPVQCLSMLFCMLVSESWNWQFRSTTPPTRLLRQTWAYEDHSAAAA